MNRILAVALLDRPIHAGDHHDKPLRWTVTGQGATTQHFRTKEHATLWARIYRKEETFRAAQLEWLRRAK